MGKIVKKQIIDDLANKLFITKDESEVYLEAFTEYIMNKVAEGYKVSIVGFGSFQASKRAARNGFNPSKRELMEIPAMSIPSFKAGNSFKEIVR